MSLNFCLLSLSCAVLFASCASQPSIYANVEDVERQAPVTPLPATGAHQAGQNAVDYANDRLPRSRYQGHHGYGSRSYENSAPLGSFR